MAPSPSASPPRLIGLAANPIGLEQGPRSSRLRWHDSSPAARRRPNETASRRRFNAAVGSVTLARQRVVRAASIALRVRARPVGRQARARSAIMSPQVLGLNAGVASAGPTAAPGSSFRLAWRSWRTCCIGSKPAPLASHLPLHVRASENLFGVQVVVSSTSNTKVCGVVRAAERS